MKRVFLSLMVSMAFTSLFASGQQESAVPAAETKSEAKAETADSDPGKLVIYSAGPGSLSGAMAEKFTEMTGIEVELFKGTTGKVLGRLESEKDNPQADVVVLASWPAGMGLVNNGLVMQYKDAENGDKLRDNWNMDGYLFGYSASALAITYNKTMIDNPGTDWSDFTTPEYKDMVIIPDPSQSGSALDFIAGYISNNPESGWDLFEGLVDNGIMVDGANRPALNTVVTGSKALVLAGVDYMAYGDIKKGEPLGVVYAKSGTVVNPRPAMILKSARNVENAKKYINFILSEEGQALVTDKLIIPGRKDVPENPNRTSLADINQFPIDWDWMMAEQKNVNSKFQDLVR